MEMNTSKCNHLTPLRFKGLTICLQGKQVLVMAVHNVMAADKG